MIYAYLRVSTIHQKLQRQQQNIERYANDNKIIIDKVYSEKYTAGTTERPEFKKLLKKVVAGDTIIFDSVSRMSRQAEEGFETWKDLYNRNVNLIFLNEPYCNTEEFRTALNKSIKIDLGAGETPETELIQTILDAMNNYLFALAENHIKQAFEQAEKELKDIRKRVSDGIRASDKTQGGTQRKGKEFWKQETLKQILKRSKFFYGETKDIDLIEGRNPICTKPTFYKYKKHLLYMTEEERQQILKG